MRLRNWGEIMAEYVDRFALRDALYDADAITMRGVKIINQFPTAVDTATVQWIPVTERLPDTFRTVIVCRENVKGEFVVEQGFKDVGDWWKVYGTRTKKVTHWMPLPEPPEAEAALEGGGNNA